MERNPELPILRHGNSLADLDPPIELIDQVQAWAQKMLKTEKNTRYVEITMQTRLMSVVHGVLVEMDYQRNNEIDPAPEEWFWRRKI